MIPFLPIHPSPMPCPLVQFPVAHPSWDVHSFGVLFFEMLVSTHLFPCNARNDNIVKMKFDCRTSAIATPSVEEWVTSSS